MKSIGNAICATGLLVMGVAPWGPSAARAQAPAPIEAACLCASGHVPGQFRAIVAVTDANRAELQRRIEAGEIAFRQNVTIHGGACTSRPGAAQGGCGSSSMQVTNAQGVSETRMADDVVTQGARTLRVTGTAGIPLQSGTPPGTTRIDPERWARVETIGILGRLP